MPDFLKNKVTAGVLIFFIAYSIFNFFAGEKNEVRGGFFYDGSVYADITIHFDTLVWHKGPGLDPYKHDTDQFTHGISDYLIQRTAPLALVYYTLKATGASFTNLHVIRCFEWWNFVYIIISIIAWHYVIRKHALSLPLQALSYILLFANFAMLKLNYFYPVLTDTPAFCLMVLSLWAWQYRKPFWLLFFMLLGAFTWPSFYYLGALLLFFMPDATDDIHDARSPLRIYGTVAFGVMVAVFLVWVFFIRHLNNGVMSYFEGEWLAEKVSRTLLPLSVPLVFAYLVIIFYHLFQIPTGVLFNVKKYFDRKHIVYAALIAILFLGTKGVIHVLKGYDSVVGIKLYFRNIFLRSAVDPLTFLVSNIDFFGIVFVLMGLYLRPFLREIQRYGLGPVGVMAFAVIFSINSESRQLTYLIPFFVFFLMPVLATQSFTVKSIAALGVVGLLFSRFWLPMNHGAVTGDPLLFPDQWYFMNMGPWMTHDMYYYMLGMAVLLTLSVIVLVKWKSKSAFASDGNGSVHG